jgi:excisionase family DNA binding protein
MRKPNPLPAPIVSERLLTAPEVAAYCAVSLRTVRRWIDDGKLPALQLGRAIRIDGGDLERLLARARNDRA